MPRWIRSPRTHCPRLLGWMMLLTIARASATPKLDTYDDDDEFDIDGEEFDADGEEIDIDADELGFDEELLDLDDPADD